MKFVCCVALATLAMAQSAPAPAIDYHQHLFSPAAAALVLGKPDAPGISAKEVVALLDDAGIQRALVLSMAYTWGKASRAAVENEYEQVRAENDWTSKQVAQFPDRLRAFCSVNPLKPYALQELVRCSKDPQLRHGLKLHFGNSDVDLDNPDNVAQVKKVFAAANANRMAVVVHLHASIDNKRNYGADQARIFLNEVLPAAPDVPVQIAHLAGSGGYNDRTDAALGVFVDAITKRDVRVRNLWFDAAVVARPGMAAVDLERIAARIRQIGVERVLYGSDAAASPQTYPKAGWTAIGQLPLTPAELRVIATNVAPYMRDLGAAVQAQGNTLAGRVVDKDGGVIPGARVVVTRGGTSQTAVTDANGRFRFAGLSSAAHEITISLVGFRTKVQTSTPAAASSSELVITLEVGVLVEVLYVVPRPSEAYQKADAIVHLRIESTRGPSECGERMVTLHSARVLRAFKGVPPSPFQFRQDVSGRCKEGDRWVEAFEEAYRAGDEFVVFLTASPDGFGRLAGPSLAFPVHGGRVDVRNFAGVKETLSLAELAELLDKVSKAKYRDMGSRW